MADLSNRINGLEVRMDKRFDKLETMLINRIETNGDQNTKIVQNTERIKQVENKIQWRERKVIMIAVGIATVAAAIITPVVQALIKRI